MYLRTILHFLGTQMRQAQGPFERTVCCPWNEKKVEEHWFRSHKDQDGVGWSVIPASLPS